MYNRKTHGTSQPSINEGYESDVDVIKDGRKLSLEINSILESADNVKEDSNHTNEATRSIPAIPAASLPTRNTFSNDNLLRTQLSDIPEEIRRDHSRGNSHLEPDPKLNSREGSHVNMGFENMSLSNFKKVHGNIEEESPDNNHNFKRDASHASILQMKDFHDDSIHTGLNFRKVSTFVITPGEERLNIKLIDRPSVPELFIQFDSLKVNHVINHQYWMETSRWIKFEEDYNCDSQHFNYAHLSPLSIKAVTNFKNIFAQGEALLDCQCEKYSDVLNVVYRSFDKSDNFNEAELVDIRKALSVKHYHVGDNVGLAAGEIPAYVYDEAKKCFQKNLEIPMGLERSSISHLRMEGLNKIFSNARLDTRLEVGTESASVQVGALDRLERTFSLFIRFHPPLQVDDLTEVKCPLRFIFVIFGPKNKENDLLEMGRVFASMMANQEFREIGYSANCFEDLREAAKVFVAHSVLVSPNKIMTHETLAAMLPQMKQYYQTFINENNQKIFDNMKKEITNNNQDITLNSTEDGKSRRISIMPAILNQPDLIEDEGMDNKSEGIINEASAFESRGKKCRKVMSQFCPPLRYYIHDWIGFKRRFVSDYRDAFNKVNAPIVFVAFIFVYFVVLTPAITFGALLNAVNPKMTITMMLLASGFFQLFNTLFGGQPFDIVGITGPVFAAEKTLGSLAIMLSIDLGAMRFWIGIYIAAQGILFTIFNGVVIIKHIRRSVEEIYNFLVAAIYVMSAIFSMFIPLQYAPVTEPIVNGSNINVIVAERLKLGIGGTTLFLAFFMTNFCLILIGIRKGTFLRRKIRKLLGSLNVPLGILLIVAMARIFFQSCSLPTLNVPPSNQVNFSLWFNIPTIASLLAVTPQGHGFCFLISVSIFTTFTCEVACNGIMTSKSERKLLKPSLYSLNFFNVHVIFPLISGILGWPFVSGGTVRSHIHCIAMAIWSVRLPGVPSKVIGSAEQRISGSLVGLLVLLSVFFGSALQFIPMAALYGMFIYMGIMGVIDLVFIRRFVNVFRRRKYWKPHDFLKDYPTWNILTLVSSQLVTVGILVILNCLQQFTTLAWTPLLYAPTIGTYALVRGYILPKWKRLNTHLSKMDKKHPIKLYADIQNTEQVIVTVDNAGVNMTVVQTTDGEVYNNESEEESDTNEYENQEKKTY